VGKVGSGGTDAGELRPWRRRWRRRRRNRAPRVDSDGGEEEEETADLWVTLASLGVASNGGIGRLAVASVSGARRSEAEEGRELEREKIGLGKASRWRAYPPGGASVAACILSPRLTAGEAPGSCLAA
jgi:hypothetical protein